MSRFPQSYSLLLDDQQLAALGPQPRAAEPEVIEEDGHTTAIETQPDGRQSFYVQGDPYEAQRRREEQRHRQEFIELNAQREWLEGRKDHMNPRAYAAQAAGLEYDLAQFEAGTSEAFADRRNLRKAAKDVQTATAAFRNNEIDERQLSQITDSLERTYGPNILTHIPAWRELQGADSAFQEAKSQMVAAQEERFGVEQGAMRFDERSGEVDFDDRYLTARQIRYQDEQLRQKPLTEMRQYEQEMAQKEYNFNLDLAAKQRTAALQFYEGNADPQAQEKALRLYDEIAGKAKTRFDERMTALSQQAQQIVQQPAARPAEQPVAAPPASPAHPKLPAGVKVFGAYNTPEELFSANPPHGAYVMGGGRLYRVNQLGELEAVE